MLIAAGLLLLAILVLAMWTNSQLEQRRTEVETKALDSARDMTALADAEAEANARLLALMADAPAAADRDMTRMTRFFDLTLAANPSWNGLVLRDTASGAVILEKGRQPGAGSLRPLPGVLPDRLGVEACSPRAAIARA
jgi:Na+-transporting methylmalonyl-CoA/oxaloacetate decarboxylase gamma subunit